MSQQIKAIFIDIDKTLTTSKDKLKMSIDDIHAIKRAQKKGIHIVIATGRSEVDAFPIHDQLMFNDFGRHIIHSNGSVLDDRKNNKRYFEKTLPKKLMNQIIKFAVENNWALKFSNDDQLYAEHKTFMFKMISKAFNVDVVPMKTLNSKTANQRKVGIVAGNRKQAKKALEMLKEKFDNVEIVLTGQGYYIEITAKGISKYSAAKFLAKDLGFELSESMAIGDSMNDAMLFKHVGVSVAMANSMKELFPLSTHQTDSVKKSGVSRAINSLIKKR